MVFRKKVSKHSHTLPVLQQKMPITQDERVLPPNPAWLEFFSHLIFAVDLKNISGLNTSLHILRHQQGFS